jgi:hypothetical protein
LGIGDRSSYAASVVAGDHHRRVHTTRIALAPFLRRLRDRLEVLDAEHLREALMAHAATLEPAARLAFLAIFDDDRDLGAAPADDSLPADVTHLVERISAGEYFDGWGWDDDLHDERAWGDESWAGEMDDLFARTGQAFLADDLRRACEAYRRLFDALLLDEEVGTFSGPSPAPEMLTADLTEAKARALRALYEISEPDDRIDALATAIGDWRYLGDAVGIRAVADALPGELAGLDVFLGDWIAGLRPTTGGQLSHDNRVLLVEAAAWRDGPDGVGALASDHGADNPELFVAWVDTLIDTGRASEAAAACAHALATMPAHGEPRAQIAERSATLSAEPADKLAAARQAWRAALTTPRLRRLATLADTTTLTDEADTLDEAAVPARLAAALLVLAGRIDDATILLQRTEPLGWSRGDHPGPLVLPFLLLAAAGNDPHNIARLHGANALLAAVDLSGWRDMRHLLDRDDDDDEPIPGEDEPLPELSALLAERVRTVEATDDQRLRWLGRARAIADARIAAIVQAKHRGAYDRAAQLAVACAEALALTEGPPAAARAITELRDRYPRHVAFRAALDAATTKSPLLPSSPRRRR